MKINKSQPYFYYSPHDDEFYFFSTKEERDDNVYELVKDYNDGSLTEDEFNQVEDIFTGEITHCVQKLNEIKRPDDLNDEGYDEDGLYWEEECTSKFDLELVSIEELE